MLDSLRLPEDIQKLDINELIALSGEVRTRIIDVVRSNGGHLSASLGAVEITIALLNRFNPSRDIILYDVGHQSYAYKLLTDRRDRFVTLRKYGGISGFPNPMESVYDRFSAGHAGNALAASCGYARARKLNGESHHIVSVLGDGVLINGLTAESLNNTACSGKQIIIINDNDFSISKSVGSLSEYLGKLDGYSLYDGIITNNSPFAIYNLDYIGGVDGHSFDDLLKALDLAKNHDRSLIIHTRTVKGKGLAEAEVNPSKYHAVGNGKGVSFSDVLGKKLSAMAQKNKKIVAVTAAMGIGAGLESFERNAPGRFFDVGIAEGHAVTMAAAMARSGLKPYVAIYSTFLQRAYDQIINDVCLSSLPVTFCIDRSGIVGEDGATHHGIFDLNYLMSIPNMTVASPASLAEFESIIEWSESFDAPLAIRYPRGAAVEDCPSCIELPKWLYCVNNHSDNALIATGASMVQMALGAQILLEKEGIMVDVVNARFNKPLDIKLLEKLKDKRIFTIEDGLITGGFGDRIRAFFNGKKVYSKGVEDCFVTHGDTSSLYRELGLDEASIAAWIKGALNEA